MNSRPHIASLAIVFASFCTGLTSAQSTPVAEIQKKTSSIQSVSSIAISPDGAYLAVSRYSTNGNETRSDVDNDMVEIWPLRSLLGPHAFATNLHPVRTLAFSHSSQWLGAASQGFETIRDEPPAAPQIFVGKVYLWHVADSSEVKLSRPKIHWFYGDEGTYDEWSATSVAFSADDKQVVADIYEVGNQPEYDVHTTFFDIETGRAVNSKDLDTGNSDTSYWHRFSWLSPDGRHSLVLTSRGFDYFSSRGNKFDYISTLTGLRVKGFAPPQIVLLPSDQDACDLGIHAFGFAAFQPDMRQMALANDGQLEIRDARTGTIRTQTTLKPTNDAPKSFAGAFSPDGNELAVSRCGQRSEVRLYETSALQLHVTWSVESVQTSLQFAPDGSLLFTAGMDGLIRVWDTEKLTLLVTIFRFPNGEWVVFSPDGLYDASAEGAAFLVWHLEGQSISASDLQGRRQSGLLSIIVSGKRPKPNTPLTSAITNALSHSHD